MLSTLPKLADRSFIVGFLLPTILALVVGFALFGNPITVRELLQGAKEDTAILIFMVGGTWLLAVLVSLFNETIYRFLEGYIPPLSWWRWGKSRAGQRIDKLREDAKRRDTQLQSAPNPADQKAYSKLLEKLAGLPPTSDDALPTRFGNAIRAFELYPNEAYGADGVTLWFRVAAFVPSVLLET